MMIQLWNRFDFNLGEPPRLQKKTIPWYVERALTQPGYIVGGDWMLTEMKNDGVIRIKDGSTFSFVRLTSGKRKHMNVIPRALNACYMLMSDPKTANLIEGNIEQLVSVALALQKVVV